MATIIFEPGPSGNCHKIAVQQNGSNTTETLNGVCPPATSASSSSAADPPATPSPTVPPPAANSAPSTSTQAGPGTTPTPTSNPAPGTENNISASWTIVSVSSFGNGTSNDTATSPLHSPGNKGLAGGAVAGVAIGMLLAGVLIAGMVFFFLLRRQKKRHAMSAVTYSRQQAPYTERDVGPEKGAAVVTAAVGNINDLLPQPVEDDAITGDLSKIRDNIKNHVRTYYHSGPISAADVNEAGIHDIAVLTGSSAAVLVKTLLNPSTRDSALRSIVGSVVLTRCTGEGRPSLLPSEVAALATSIPVNSGINFQAVLFSKWKTITAALLQQQYGKQSQDSGRTQNFQDTVTSLDSVLAPFVNGSVDGGQRRRNLDMILTRAANFAFLLFSQPGSFRFDFVSRQGGLTVFPALVQTVGDQGQPLSPVKVLTEKEVVAA